MDRDEHLMAVLLGESVPRESVPREGEGGAGRAAAERDMALVREHLHRIGDGLAGAAAPTPEPAPEPAPAGRRRARFRRRVLYGLAASVALALLGTGGAYLAAHHGGGGGQALLTDGGLVACSTAIAEGTIAGVEPAGGRHRFRIVLDVEQSYRPAAGKPRLVFTEEGAEVPAYYRKGARMLVVVSGTPGEPPLTFRAGDPAYDRESAHDGESTHDGTSEPPRDALEWGRRWVERALPEARGLECRVG
ncbi:hypothetical protein [Streptomyces liangshanensis]|uniref:Uncharacterized protein n=1 Tax=Streptomyces liangshanensis TaxID=2717324 RepID=A0A6G9H3W0_9ACTN|nr:hypothetical protein [Streptomyces liangshanensis]QIQ04807.1 hypothetical protein HA039_23265 [Streptomyces liangshanensis]